MATLQALTIFGVSGAGGLIPLCCLCLYFLLKRVNRARLKLFNVFLVSDQAPLPGILPVRARNKLPLDVWALLAQLNGVVFMTWVCRQPLPHFSFLALPAGCATTCGDAASD